MIIETSNYQVREAGAGLQHVWLGVEVKRVKGGFAPKAKAREVLVRKEASHIVTGAERC
jgi:hypothetical protein